MESWINTASAFIAAHRAWAGIFIGLLTFGESFLIIGAFIPATAGLIAIGALMASGLVDPTSVAFWAIAGAFAGDWASYEIGRLIGPRAFRTWPLNRNRRSVARTKLIFRRYGAASLIAGRFLGPLRATVPTVAGILAMNRRRFQAANLASAIIWISALLTPGYLGALAVTGHAQLTVGALVVISTGLATAWIIHQVALRAPTAGAPNASR